MADKGDGELIYLDDVKVYMSDWADWKAYIAGKSALDSRVTNYSGVRSQAKPSTIVPEKYLEKSASKRIQLIENCFILWPEAHQVAIDIKYVLPTRTEEGVVMFESEKDRIAFAAKELGISHKAVYNLISEAHLMVWQVFNFKRWDLVA
ncbi:MAG: hypothetical protein JAY60_18455 [Candidatus Thiodiazotropha weberae]|nr:hypothetical protein [Candidatus Thiodiazotropha weberae]